MKLVETVRTRWVLGLAAIAFAGSAAAVAMRPCPHAAEKKVVAHRHVKAPRACREWTRPAPPKHDVTGADYRDVLLAQKPAFEACIAKAKPDVTYTLTATIDGTGIVRSVDVKAATSHMRSVDLKAVKCLEQALSGATFPAVGSEKRVSTTLRKS